MIEKIIKSQKYINAFVIFFLGMLLVVLFIGDGSFDFIFANNVFAIIIIFIYSSSFFIFSKKRKRILKLFNAFIGNESFAGFMRDCIFLVLFFLVLSGMFYLLLDIPSSYYFSGQRESYTLISFTSFFLLFLLLPFFKKNISDKDKRDKYLFLVFVALNMVIIHYRADIVFIINNHRIMNLQERIVYNFYGDPRLVDSDYCKQISGKWTTTDYLYNHLLSGEENFYFCAPRTGDGGKKCYSDDECESYCEVDYEYSSYGNCYPYQIKRPECGEGYYYFKNGEVKHRIGIWC